MTGAVGPAGPAGTVGTIGAGWSGKIGFVMGNVLSARTPVRPPAWRRPRQDAPGDAMSDAESAPPTRAAPRGADERRTLEAPRTGRRTTRAPTEPPSRATPCER